MFKFLTTAAALIAVVSAHVAIVDPCPRYSPNNNRCPALPAGASVDYDMRSPLGYNEPLCKHTTPYNKPAATWTAGQSITVKFDIGAAHGGGHCQFSLSYDGGKTFVVIHEELKHCFFNGPSSGNSADVSSYTFKLPSNVPSSDNAIFAWSWVNAIGAREFYMNCADVAIKGSSGSYTGKRMTIANHAGYPTIPEFGGNYDTGLEYYKNAKGITVTGNGSSSGGGNNGGSEGNGETDYSVPPVGHTPLDPEPTDYEPESTRTHRPRPTRTNSPKPTSTSRPKPTSTSRPKPTRTNSPKPTRTSRPKPTSGYDSDQDESPQNPGSGRCNHGDMRCASSGSGYQACIWGKWSGTISCAPDTACMKVSDSQIACDWFY